MSKEPVSDKMIEIIRKIEKALIEGDYSSVSSVIINSRLSAEEIRTAIDEYKQFAKIPGRKITPAPDNVVKQIKAIRVRNSNPPHWYIDYDLWIGSKQSDLTVQLSLTSNEYGKISAGIDDIHIL